VLGDYSMTASRDVLLALKHDTHPTAKADLFRRRFAHSGELPPAAKLDEAQVKELSGGDRIKARRMREDFWEFDPSHLLWLHANHRPMIEGTDDGIWRLVHLIPFNIQTSPNVVIPD
jgi:putative DNA primase/helicase